MPAAWFDVTDELQANEDLFEWVDLLESVASAGDRFVMLDLGAGYGRWLVNAALACRQQGKDFFVAGVEAEDVHYQWMLEHLADNDIPDGQSLAIHAPVSDVEKEVLFTCGHPTEWYGQTILTSADTPYGDWPRSSVKARRAVAIGNLLTRLGRLDSLHADVQGEEKVIFPACIDLLDRAVKRVHIGTHSREIDDILRRLFSEHGWENHFSFPCQTERVATPFGVIDFQDGVQSWINPRL